MKIWKKNWQSNLSKGGNYNGKNCIKWKENYYVIHYPISTAQAASKKLNPLAFSFGDAVSVIVVFAG